jgi:hypothetical protein
MTDIGENCVVATSGPRLEGRFRPAASVGTAPGAGAVVAPPHPLYGGTLSNPVVVAAADGFAEAGVATLSFNYRGIEDSEGQASDAPAAALDDYSGALDTLAGRVPGPYLAAGYSFGARTALAVAARDPRVRGAVLIAPPVDLVDAGALAAFTGPLLVIVGDRDAYAPLDRLRAWLAARPDATLEIVPGADHFFGSAGAASVTALVAGRVPSWL